MDTVMVLGILNRTLAIDFAVGDGMEMRRTCVSKGKREHVPQFINALTSSSDIPETGLE